MSKLGLEWTEGEKKESTGMVQYEEPPKPPALVHEWPNGLAIEVGLNSLSADGTVILSDEDLCRQFDLTPEELAGIKLHPAFRAEVRETLSQIKDSHATIKRKARIAFEHYMSETVPFLMNPNNDKIPADVRLKTIQYLGKIIGLEAASEAAQAESAKAANNVPSINITLTTAAPVSQPTITIDNAERLN